MFFKRNTSKRTIWLKFGVGISSIYMIFTFGNKIYMDSVFKESLIAKGVSFKRYYAQPTIFNNVLWYGIAETDSTYHVGYYSLLDEKDIFSDFKELPKVRALSPSTYSRVRDLAWFSNDFYSIYKIGDNEYQYNDLRYPLIDEDSNSSVFRFSLYEENNQINMKAFERTEDNVSDALNALWERLKGK